MSISDIASLTFIDEMQYIKRIRPTPSLFLVTRVILLSQFNEFENRTLGRSSMQDRPRGTLRLVAPLHNNQLPVISFRRLFFNTASDSI